jgi:hypothetical protein
VTLGQQIRAGGASVEIVADPRKLDSGLREAESKLRDYNQRVRQLNREATAAATQTGGHGTQPEDRNDRYGSSLTARRDPSCAQCQTSDNICYVTLGMG